MTKWSLFLFLCWYPLCGIIAQGVRLPTWKTANGLSLPIPSTNFVVGTLLSKNPHNPTSDLYFLARVRPVAPHYPSSAPKGELLPKWRPEVLPFFCRVEHNCGKKLPFAFKLRLGSVEYVDWLEGKSAWINQ